MRSFADLTEHLTARADDSHAAPVTAPVGRSPFGFLPPRCQTQVRFFVYLELNHTLRCLCGAPSIPLSFSLATVLLRRHTYRVSFGTPRGFPPRTPSMHRLRHGLPGFLIPFAPHAFASQRQLRARVSPSPLVFLRISTHFTTTPGIPHPSPVLQTASLSRPLPV